MFWLLRLEFCIQMMCHHPIYLGVSNFSWSSQTVWVDKVIIYIAIVYTLLCKLMVTISRHSFIHIFQTVHFSAVKFTRGNEKNRILLLIPKSQKAWEEEFKKSEVIRPGSFKVTRFQHSAFNNHIMVLSLVERAPKAQQF